MCTLHCTVYLSLWNVNEDQGLSPICLDSLFETSGLTGQPEQCSLAVNPAKLLDLDSVDTGQLEREGTAQRTV